MKSLILTTSSVPWSFLHVWMSIVILQNFSIAPLCGIAAVGLLLIYSKDLSVVEKDRMWLFQSVPTAQNWRHISGPTKCRAWFRKREYWYFAVSMNFRLWCPDDLLRLPSTSIPVESVLVSSHNAMHTCLLLLTLKQRFKIKQHHSASLWLNYFGSQVPYFWIMPVTLKTWNALLRHSQWSSSSFPLWH